ncbi:hypothetical protein [Yersinia rochesterensis]|uniref:hypothetical protein n=1 Tax=Yersinia rochesterensis TaxID=1604335 RepID=UPI0005E2D1D7|nr:hypothetical protein [Yersinia rochesterensis]CNI38224.1 Uncharacterised protein [Yersinia frederiksenii]
MTINGIWSAIKIFSKKIYSGLLISMKTLWWVISYPFIKHQATNNIVIAIVTALTLIWAGVTFNILQQRELAQASLDVSKSELIKSKSELEKTQEELLEIRDRIKNSESTTVKLNSSFSKSGKDKGYYIYANVTIKNNGKKKMLMSLKEDSLTISQINLDGDEVIAEKKYHPYYFEVISDNIEESSKKFKMIEIPVDGERTLPFAIKVKSKGLYYITFQSEPYHDNERREVDEHELIWFAAEYIDVK